MQEAIEKIRQSKDKNIFFKIKEVPDKEEFNKFIQLIYDLGFKYLKYIYRINDNNNNVSKYCFYSPLEERSVWIDVVDHCQISEIYPSASFLEKRITRD